MNVRTKGFCSALLRCEEIKLIAEKREYAISDLIANIARSDNEAVAALRRGAAPINKIIQYASSNIMPVMESREEMRLLIN